MGGIGVRYWVLCVRVSRCDYYLLWGGLCVVFFVSYGSSGVGVLVDVVLVCS